MENISIISQCGLEVIQQWHAKENVIKWVAFDIDIN